jgi:hypothetical protein
MNFTETEIQYLTLEAQAAGRKVLDEFYRNVHNVIFSIRDSYGVSEEALFAAELKKCARSVVDAHVERFIALSAELQKFPDGEDLTKLSEFTQPFVTNLLPRYRVFAERPLGANISREVVDAREKTLEFELRTIFSEGWFPMNALHMKGRVEEERT